MSLEQHDEVTVRHRNYREDKGGPMKVFVVPDHQPKRSHDNQDLDKLPSEHCDSTWAVRRQKFRQHQKQREERLGTA